MVYVIQVCWQLASRIRMELSYTQYQGLLIQVTVTCQVPRIIDSGDCHMPSTNDYWFRRLSHAQYQGLLIQETVTCQVPRIIDSGDCHMPSSKDYWFMWQPHAQYQGLLIQTTVTRPVARIIDSGDSHMPSTKDYWCSHCQSLSDTPFIRFISGLLQLTLYLFC